MTKSEDFWRSKGAANSWGLVKLAHAEGVAVRPIFLSWSHNSGARFDMGRLNGYYVISPFFKTDPEGGHWQDYGNKTFPTFMSGGKTAAEHRELALRAAQEWCNLNYGTTEWGKVPGFGWDWFPIEIVKWAKQKAREG